MTIHHTSKKGDTLIEVALAVGIFSMVAIAILSVMNAGSSNAQTALEATLAREEVDSQAEAIRFIHSAYVANINSSANADSEYTGPWQLLWQDIADSAISADEAKSSNFYDYQPSTCSSLYSGNSGTNSNSFVLDIKNLVNGETSVDKILIKNATSPSMFREASTYPQLVYKDNTLEAADGLYITAVKDSGTKIAQDGSVTENTSAYYDFYIRTCWYGTGDKTPSTVSTVIRLYNPEIDSFH